MPFTVLSALTDLMGNPRRFLSRHPIAIVGGNVHGAMAFGVNQTDRPTGTRSNMFHRRVSATEGLRFMRNQPGPAVQAYNVMMYAFGGALQWLNIPAPAPAQPRMILTGQLTGCSFVVEDQGAGAIRCAHAQHGANQTSAALRTDLGNAGHGHLYGHGEEYDLAVNQVYVVGVAREGRWKVYAQKLSGTFDILSVDRVY